MPVAARTTLELGGHFNLDLSADFGAEFDSGSGDLAYDVGWLGAITEDASGIFFDTSKLTYGLGTAETEAPRVEARIGVAADVEAGLDARLVVDVPLSPEGLVFDIYEREVSAGFDGSLIDLTLDLGDPANSQPSSTLLDFELSGDQLNEGLAEFSEDLSSSPLFDVALQLPNLPEGTASFDAGETRVRRNGEGFATASLDLDALAQTAIGGAPKDLLETKVDVELESDGDLEIEVKPFLGNAGVDEEIKVPLPRWLLDDEDRDILTAALDLAILDVELFASLSLYQEINFDPTDITIRATDLGEEVTVSLGEIAELPELFLSGPVDVALGGTYFVETGIALDLGVSVEVLSVDAELAFDSRFFDFDTSVDFSLIDTELTLRDLGVEPDLGYSAPEGHVNLWSPVFDGAELLDGGFSMGSPASFGTVIEYEAPEQADPMEDLPPDVEEADDPPPLSIEEDWDVSGVVSRANPFAFLQCRHPRGHIRRGRFRIHRPRHRKTAGSGEVSQ